MRISDGSSDVCASDLVFLLESGSDRIGALDFQTSATAYVPRGGGHATLEELLLSAEKVERNLPLTPELDAALHHGSSIGGARPKALITDGARKYVRSEERRVGKECVSKCRSRWSPDH